jgi:hypothetical protein
MITIFNDEENISKLEKPLDSPRKFNFVGLALWLATFVVVVSILVKLIQ